MGDFEEDATITVIPLDPDSSYWNNQTIPIMAARSRELAGRLATWLRKEGTNGRPPKANTNVAYDEDGSQPLRRGVENGDLFVVIDKFRLP